MSDFLGSPDNVDTDALSHDAEERVKTLSLVRHVTMERRKSFSDVTELENSVLDASPGVISATSAAGGPDMHGQGLAVAQGRTEASALLSPPLSSPPLSSPDWRGEEGRGEERRGEAPPKSFPHTATTTSELRPAAMVSSVHTGAYAENDGSELSAPTGGDWAVDVGVQGDGGVVEVRPGTTPVSGTHFEQQQQQHPTSIRAPRAARGSIEGVGSPLPPVLSRGMSLQPPPHTLPAPSTSTLGIVGDVAAANSGGIVGDVPVGVTEAITGAATLRRGQSARRRAVSGSLEIEEIDVSDIAAFQRVAITGIASLGSEQKAACAGLKRALELRDKHTYKKPDYYWGALRPAEFPFSPTARPPPRYVGSGHRDDTVVNHAEQNHIAWDARNLPITTPQLPSMTERPSITPDRIKSPPQPKPTEGGADKHLITPTLTGVVASATAATRAAHKMLHGSKLVTLETGKEYGNLFYRRRLEPPYAPFAAPIAPPGDQTLRMIDGVMCVFPTSRLAEEAPAGHPHAGPTRGDSIVQSPSVDMAAPSRDFMDTAELEGELMYGSSEKSLFPVPPFREYHADYNELVKIIHTAYVKSFAYRRLQLLDARFHLHTQLNAEREMAESKAVPHRDFYNVRKVDTHVHHSACMNQKHLLNFIKAKLKNDPDEIVILRDGKKLTLKEVFESLSLTAYDLSVDTLDMHADWSTFHRFDRFNLKYNPVGQSRLREIFLKTDNYIKGKYLAEITQEVFSDLEAAKYSLAEFRLSIYGKSRDEWSKLASWVVDNKLASPQVRWMIQIPRLYEAYRETGAIASFQDMLNNIFLPLFEVTRDPSIDPKLHQFLGIVVGLDSVDDESKQEMLRDSADVPPPASWTGVHQPPYYYWNYFLSANLAVLNMYRESRGMTQFSFRPHSGEAGDVDHLAATFLTAESINHGINLRKNPSLQYLYYLAQIGLAVSPLSNNKLFVEYNKNPFYEYFAKGLNVSLSTDDPLILSYTREPLIEEYCVAAQVWKLTAVDLCEIARNSVLQSGFEYPYKAHFIGPNYAERGPSGNDIHSTNVPYIRLQYRLESLNAELSLIEEASERKHAAPATVKVLRAPEAAAPAPQPHAGDFSLGPPAVAASNHPLQGIDVSLDPSNMPSAGQQADDLQRRLALAMHIKQSMEAASVGVMSPT